MAKAIAAVPKKRGRPATGRDPHITVRLPQEMIDGLELWAGKNNVSRSEAVRDGEGKSSQGRRDIGNHKAHRAPSAAVKTESEAVVHAKIQAENHNQRPFGFASYVGDFSGR
jgi:hypothetical protein